MEIISHGRGLSSGIRNTVLLPALRTSLFQGMGQAENISFSHTNKIKCVLSVNFKYHKYYKLITAVAEEGKQFKKAV